MLVQKDIETKILAAVSDALTAANVTGVTSTGAWATAQAGLVKWIENPSTAAFLSVSVGSPAWQTFSTPLVEIPVSLALFIRPELDATGAKLAAVAEVIETLLRGWMAATYQQSFTALDVTNLSVDGVTLGGSASPVLRDGVCTVSWNLTLSGSYRESTNTNA